MQVHIDTLQAGAIGEDNCVVPCKTRRVMPAISSDLGVDETSGRYESGEALISCASVSAHRERELI